MPLPYVLHRYQHQENQKVASNVVAKQPVQIVGTSIPLVIPCGSANLEPKGLVDSVASVGDQVVIYKDTNIVKAVAGASLGVEVEVLVGSSNGALNPAIAASAFAASGHWIVGVSKTPAAAGETFSVEVKVRRV